MCALKVVQTQGKFIRATNVNYPQHFFKFFFNLPFSIREILQDLKYIRWSMVHRIHNHVHTEQHRSLQISIFIHPSLDYFYYFTNCTYTD